MFQLCSQQLGIYPLILETMSVEVTMTNGISSVSAISFSITFKAVLSFASCKFCDWKTFYLRWHSNHEHLIIKCCFTPFLKIFFMHIISLKIIGSESKSVTKEMTNSWRETTLPTILSNFKLEEVFNANEFGSFCQCLPDKKYHLERRRVFWGKNQSQAYWNGSSKSNRRKTAHVCDLEI